MVCTDGVVLCVTNEVDMTEYLDSSRQSLEESEMNVRHAIDQDTMDVRRFEQAERASLLGVFSRVIFFIVPSYIATASYVIKQSLLQNLYCFDNT